MFYVGYSGYSWNSAIIDTKAIDLVLEYGLVMPNYSNNRGHGLQLRCLQE
ncbi:MAG: hypothetical protein K2G93_08630 [Rikenella sp.]|nr:hypothetical protein [Rikenella sp.]